MVPTAILFGLSNTQKLSTSTQLALCLLILLIIATNMSLWLAWKQRHKMRRFDWLGKISQSIRDPWKKENQQLVELSKRVSRLKQESSDSDKEEENPE